MTYFMSEKCPQNFPVQKVIWGHKSWCYDSWGHNLKFILKINSKNILKVIFNDKQQDMPKSTIKR